MAEPIRCTVAQAVVRYLAAQRAEQLDGRVVRACPGVFAIFGHGNVGGLGRALGSVRDTLPTFRAHNEQAMGHAAVGFARASFRRRFLGCVTSIGPGATNLVTAAGVAHTNRLPVLLMPADAFASRGPDPVLQQLEHPLDASITVNDCLRPVSRMFTRVERPEQLLPALRAAMRVLFDPAECGPVTVCLPQDVQVESYTFDARAFEPAVWCVARPRPDDRALASAADRVRAAQRPILLAGGGVLYSGAAGALTEIAERRGIPVAETAAGRGSLPFGHPRLVGGIGTNGTEVANRMAREADCVIAIGTRLGDLTTASRTLFDDPPGRLVAVNASPADAHKHGALPVVGDARETIRALDVALDAYGADPAWTSIAVEWTAAWNARVDEVTRPAAGPLATDAQVLGVVQRFAYQKTTVVNAAGGLPSELHRLWRTAGPGTYHVEQGFSCMGYEIAGGLGVKLASPDRAVIVLVGDGSYLLLSSEIATSVAMSLPLVVVVFNNGGFGSIHRLQRELGGEVHNNLLADESRIDIAMNARSLGAHAESVGDLESLGAALEAALARDRTSVIVVPTDPDRSTSIGGAYWDVPGEERGR